VSRNTEKYFPSSVRTMYFRMKISTALVSSGGGSFANPHVQIKFEKTTVATTKA